MSAEHRRILVVDDERPILLTLEALLNRHGYVTDTAGTASLGLRAIKSNPPAVVLLDLQLPDAEGLQLLDQIKREHPETQVIILTAHDSLSNAIESIKRGAYHFISKPYAPEELLSLVEKRSKNNRSCARPKRYAKGLSNWRSASRLLKPNWRQFSPAKSCRKSTG